MLPYTNIYDYFELNGMVFASMGDKLGSVYIPTRGTPATCSLTAFVNAMCKYGYERPEGVHLISQQKRTYKWYGRKITKFNIAEFVLDYIEGNVPTAEKLTPLIQDNLRKGALITAQNVKLW